MSASDELLWRITPHICRSCLGRVLERIAPDGSRVFRCAKCGIERFGGDDAAICMCGLRLGGDGVDLGVRCVPNSGRHQEILSEIIAEQVGAT